MGILRTVICDVCGFAFTETSPAGSVGDGWPGWGKVYGLVNPQTKSPETMLCPKCLLAISIVLQKLSEGEE